MKRFLLIAVGTLFAFLLGYFLYPKNTPNFNKGFYKNTQLDDGHDHALIIELPDKITNYTLNYKSWIVDDEAVLEKYKYKIYTETDLSGFLPGEGKTARKLYFFKDQKKQKTSVVYHDEKLFIDDILSIAQPIKKDSLRVSSARDYKRALDYFTANNAYIVSQPPPPKTHKFYFEFEMSLPTLVFKKPVGQIDASVFQSELEKEINEALSAYSDEFRLSVNLRESSGSYGVPIMNRNKRLRDAQKKPITLKGYYLATFVVNFKSTSAFYSLDLKRKIETVLVPYLKTKDEMFIKMKDEAKKAEPPIDPELVRPSFTIKRDFWKGELNNLPELRYSNYFMYYLP